MCLKLGKDELDTVRNLMAMSLKAVVAEALECDLDEVTERARLVEDLHMDEAGRHELQALLADIFDGVAIDPAAMPTVGDLLEEVVHSEFHDLKT